MKPHTSTDSPAPTPPPFTCPICDKPFPTAEAAMRHAETAHQR
jgi:hypothetical protein